MVDARGERHLRRLERVVCREVDGQEEDPALVWRLRRAHDGGLPVEQVVAHGTGAALGWRIAAKILKLLLIPRINFFLIKLNKPSECV